MNFRKFLKQWLGYSRRERTGSMVLLVILLVVLGVRILRERSAGIEKTAAVFESGFLDSSGVVVEGRRQEQSQTESRHQAGDPAVRGAKSNVVDGSGQSRNNDRTYVDKGETKAARNGKAQAPGNANAEMRAGIASPGAELIDLNRADSAELEALPGIGPVLSVRIIKYRYLLGYFYSTDQLKDVYGLKGEVIEMNRHRFTCDTGLLRKININTASYRDLLRHPYIDERQVEAIISHRQLSGHLSGISDLIRNRIFSTEELSRLKPYLEFR